MGWTGHLFPVPVPRGKLATEGKLCAEFVDYDPFQAYMIVFFRCCSMDWRVHFPLLHAPVAKRETAFTRVSIACEEPWGMANRKAARILDLLLDSAESRAGGIGFAFVLSPRGSASRGGIPR
jgi:hypothetical protein